MSKSNAFENLVLLNFFNNSTIPNIGDATGLRGSATAGVLYLSAHTADPGEAGDQTTNECTYGSYARVSVVRSGAGFVVTGNSVSPAADTLFPEATSGSQTITHIGIGVASSGAGLLLYSGTATPNVAVVTGVAPKVKTTSTVTED